MTSNIETGENYIDQGWAWVILIASTCIMIILQGNVRSFGVFVAELQREFNSSAAAVSSILSSQAIANSISAFIVLNCLSKLVTMRVLIIMGCLFSTICFILDSQSSKIELVALYHILNGMGIAFIYGPTLVMIGHYFSRYRGTANASFSCGASVGQLMFSPLFSYMISVYGTKGALLLNAVIFFQCLTFAMLLRPTSFYGRSYAKNHEQGTEKSFTEAEEDCMINVEERNELNVYQAELKPIDNSTASVTVLGSLLARRDVIINSTDCIEQANVGNLEDSESGTLDLNHDPYPIERNNGRSILFLLRTIFTNVDFKLLKSPIFLTYFFGTSIGQLASSVPQSFFPSHAEDMGLDSKQGMLFVAIAGFADLGGRILTTLVADLKCLNRPRFLGCVLIVHGIVAFFIPLFNTFLIFTAYCVLYGASGGINFAISTTILTDYIGVEKLSQGLGLMLFFNGFTAAVAYLLIGFFRESTGSYNHPFMVNGVALVISGVFFCAEPCIKYERLQR